MGPPRPAAPPPLVRLTHALGKHSRIVRDAAKAVIDNRQGLSILKILWKKLLKE